MPRREEPVGLAGEERCAVEGVVAPPLEDAVAVVGVDLAPAASASGRALERQGALAGLVLHGSVGVFEGCEDPDASRPVARGEGDPRVAADRDELPRTQGVVDRRRADEKEGGRGARSRSRQARARIRRPEAEPDGVDRHQEQRGGIGEREQADPTADPEYLPESRSRGLGETSPVPPQHRDEQQLERGSEDARGEERRLLEGEEERRGHTSGHAPEAVSGDDTHDRGGREVEENLRAVQREQPAAAPAQDSQEVEVEGSDVKRLVVEPAALGHRSRPLPVELAVQGGESRKGILEPELPQHRQANQPGGRNQRQHDPPEVLLAQRGESPPPRLGGRVDGRGGRRGAHVGILAGTGKLRPLFIGTSQPILERRIPNLGSGF
jgi:hypothetical protein